MRVCCYPSLCVSQNAINGMILLNGLMNSWVSYFCSFLKWTVIFIFIILVDLRIKILIVLITTLVGSLACGESWLAYSLESWPLLEVEVSSWALVDPWCKFGSWGICICASSFYSSTGFTSPVASFLITWWDGSSSPKISALTCSFWEPSLSSKVTSTAI